jgi:hypothetical protein
MWAAIAAAGRLAVAGLDGGGDGVVQVVGALAQARNTPPTGRNMRARASATARSMRPLRAARRRRRGSRCRARWKRPTAPGPACGRAVQALQRVVDRSRSASSWRCAASRAAAHSLALR